MHEPKSGSKVDSILSEAARSVEQATEAVTHQATRQKRTFCRPELPSRKLRTA